jgi:4-diphosphocytidyl-2-C-methyl-D-erythritol kinase
MIFSDHARAKINLTLHVRRRREDGWHELESLVVFGAATDHLALDLSAPLALTLTGPYAQGLSAGDDNLILKAAHALKSRIPDLKCGAFHLTKNLPLAAGIGGGSADAACALRLLGRAHNLTPDHPALYEAARVIGADVPVCLASRASMMRGAGELCEVVPPLPCLYLVLVNPGVALDTKTVFARMNIAKGADHNTKAHPPITMSCTTSEALVDAIKRGRNDMEDAASVLAPVIGDVLASLAAARGCRLARMSGSGATCFGLFINRQQAVTAARVLRRDHPSWWVKLGIAR